jgi:hypothetical protein
MLVSCAERALTEANIPAPARNFRKNPRLLLMFFSLENRKGSGQGTASAVPKNPENQGSTP